MKKLKLDLQGLNAEVLTRSQLKQILGGDGIGGTGGGSGGAGECSVSTNCSGGGSISCSSKGAAGNPQGGDSCQKVEGLFVNCYDTGAPNNWNYSHC